MQRSYRLRSSQESAGPRPLLARASARAAARALASSVSAGILPPGGSTKQPQAAVLCVVVFVPVRRACACDAAGKRRPLDDLLVPLFHDFCKLAVFDLFGPFRREAIGFFHRDSRLIFVCIDALQIGVTPWRARWGPVLGRGRTARRGPTGLLPKHRNRRERQRPQCFPPENGETA